MWSHAVLLNLLNRGERSSEEKILFGVEELFFCARPGEVTDSFFLVFFFLVWYPHSLLVMQVREAGGLRVEI